MKSLRGGHLGPGYWWTLMRVSDYEETVVYTVVQYINCYLCHVHRMGGGGGGET